MQKYDNTGQKESVRKYFANALKSEKTLFFRFIRRVQPDK